MDNVGITSTNIGRFCLKTPHKTSNFTRSLQGYMHGQTAQELKLRGVRKDSISTIHFTSINLKQWIQKSKYILGDF